MYVFLICCPNIRGGVANAVAYPSPDSVTATSGSRGTIANQWTNYMKFPVGRIDHFKLKQIM